MAARLIETHTQGLPRETYEADPWLRSAAERQFEIIGEAFNNVRRLDPDLEASIPDPHGLISMRHFIAHVYDTVDHRALWDTIERDVPVLINRLPALLRDD